MSAPIRRELDVARLAARERRLRLVMRILSSRQAESERNGTPAPLELRHSIADFGEQLRDVHRRQADLARTQRPDPAGRPGRFARGAQQPQP